MKVTVPSHRSRQQNSEGGSSGSQGYPSSERRGQRGGSNRRGRNPNYTSKDGNNLPHRSASAEGATEGFYGQTQGQTPLSPTSPAALSPQQQGQPHPFLSLDQQPLLNGGTYGEDGS